jgi:hypothetical protein
MPTRQWQDASSCLTNWSSVRTMSLRNAYLVYAFLDLLCIGMGMGVPICSILLGFPVGWYIGGRVVARGASLEEALRPVLVGALATSLLTFAAMAALWGRTIVLLFDPKADLAHFGIPQILYTPRASLIGWLVLMIFLSPVFQFLMSVLGGNLALLQMSAGVGKSR